MKATADDKRPEKKEAKRTKDDRSGASSTPIPLVLAPPKLPPCACCRRMEPKATMARCKKCTFAAHAGCYGIASQDMGPDWVCELCSNVTSDENHLVRREQIFGYYTCAANVEQDPRCVLCKGAATLKRKRALTLNDPFDMLAALKPTEGRRWAHILCSAWIPEILYTNPATFMAVEGITSVPRYRWEGLCTLCNQPGGAVIGCADCAAMFHPSCAWTSGYRFGFEFSLVSRAMMIGD